MERYDVIVIGGGPSGMMAAGRAAECGARVLLLEKNTSLGVKLLLTGGGRCNVTHAEFDRNILLGHYGEAAKFLFSSFAEFGVEDTLEFFHERGMPTKVEAEERVFPKSDQAKSVLDVLTAFMQEGRVRVAYGKSVAGLDVASGKIHHVRLIDKTIVRGDSFILATGGTSRPETGSTGDGFHWLRHIGHTVLDPRPALVPLRVRESWVSALSGINLEDAALAILQNEKKKKVTRGKLLFTHFGLSGPLALNLSQIIGEHLHAGEVFISIDPLPGRTLESLDEEIQTRLAAERKKFIKNSLDKIITPRLVPIVLQLAHINPETLSHHVTRKERLALAHAMKHIPLTIIGLLDEKKAIGTGGGVALKEVDFKNMRSKLFSNLFLVGDVLNINRPSGGYSLQLCWTTGFIAGTRAAKK